MQKFTREEIASKYASGEKAYIIIEDNVYDITKFAGMHPGGEKLLLDLAGKDVSEDFWGLHKAEVLAKYGPKLLVGQIQGASGKAEEKHIDGWAKISTVPYAEPSYWRGWKSPYFNESHQKYRLAIREFLDKEVREVAEEGELSGEYPTKELYQKMGAFGLLSCVIAPGPHLKSLPNGIPGGIKPEEFTSFHEFIAHEEFGRLGTPGFADGLIAGMVISLPAVIAFGPKWMKEKVSQEVLSGNKRICLAITEPYVGSDVANIRTTAVKSADGTHYIVNGVKKWITNGCFCDYFVTAVRTGEGGMGGISVLLIERSEGLRTKQIKTSYSKSAGTAYVIFEDVKVPVQNLIHKENMGFQAIMFNFNHERLLIIARMNATSRYTLEEAFKWCHQRKVFGKNLINQPVVRGKLAEMVADLEAVTSWMENVTYQTTKMGYKEQSEKLAGDIALLKFQSTRVANKVADISTQLLGGRGITQTGMGSRIERFMRTYKFGAILGGSEEVMADLGIRQATKNWPDDAPRL